MGFFTSMSKVSYLFVWSLILFVGLQRFAICEDRLTSINSIVMQQLPLPSCPSLIAGVNNSIHMDLGLDKRGNTTLKRVVLMEWHAPEFSNLHFEGEIIDRKLRLDLKLTTPEVREDRAFHRAAISGKDAFKVLMKFLAGYFDVIIGEWSDKFPGQQDNINKLNELLASGLPIEESIKGVWTGKMAVAEGYTSARVLSFEVDPATGRYTYIEVEFSKPSP